MFSSTSRHAAQQQHRQHPDHAPAQSQHPQSVAETMRGGGGAWRDAAGLASDEAPLVTDAHLCEPLAEKAYVVELWVDNDAPRLVDQARLASVEVTDLHRCEPVAEGCCYAELRMDDDVPRLVDEAPLASVEVPDLHRCEPVAEGAYRVELRIDDDGAWLQSRRSGSGSRRL